MQVRLVADPGVTLAVPITAQVIDLGTGTATSGSDYAAFGTQTVTFEIGSGGGTERSVTLTAIDDDLVEGAENVNLQLGTLTGPGAALGAPLFHEVVIGDDDQNAGPPLAIVDIVVNDGSAQRSNIETISIRFNQATNLQQLITDSQIASAVQLFGAAQTQIILTAVNYHYDEQSFTLTIDLTVDGFGGSRKTMLADGRYQVRLSTGLIRAAENTDNVLLDDDELADAIRRFDFHKLLADFNGNAQVDLTDRNLFYEHYGARAGDATYDFAYDLDGDGDVDYTDYLIWRSQYRKKV